MKVILLERVESLGGIGDVVKVKDGFARNFLLPHKKALRATDANLKVFEGRRAEIEARNAEAKRRGRKGLRQAGRHVLRPDPLRPAKRGQLYGSVSARDVADGSSRPAARSTAARSCSTSRSRRSACTR